MSSQTPDWQTLGAVAPAALAPARLAAHHAAQLVQSYARSLLLPRADDSQAVLRWSSEHDALLGEPVEGSRAGLRPADLTLLFLGSGESRAATCPLEGRTLDDGRDWVRSQMGRNAAAHTLDTPYEIPHDGMDFDKPLVISEPEAYRELSRWYANVDTLLREFVARTDDASPVRVWPHHFDIATLVPVAGETTTEVGRSIGIGMSPGDESYDRPYIYVSPWPYPEHDALPELSGGARWHTDGFTAAVLMSEDLIAAGDGPAQSARAREFVDSTVAACRTLLA